MIGDFVIMRISWFLYTRQHHHSVVAVWMRKLDWVLVCCFHCRFWCKGEQVTMHRYSRGTSRRRSTLCARASAEGLGMSRGHPAVSCSASGGTTCSSSPVPHCWWLSIPITSRLLEGTCTAPRVPSLLLCSSRLQNHRHVNDSWLSRVFSWFNL